MPSAAESLSILDSVSSPQAGIAPTDIPSSGRPRIWITPRDQAGPPSKMDILDQGIAGKLETPAAPTREVGAGEALGRGLASGLTANFYDELRGLHEAGGGGADEPFSLGTILRGAAARFTNDADAERRYGEAVSREREAGKLAAEQHPVANIVGNVGGALALPIGGIGAAATLPGRMAAGAGLGAAYGGAFGAGEGTDIEDRAKRAASGAVLGGAFGGAAPAVLTGIGKGASYAGSVVNSALGRPVQTMRALLNPEEEAARKVGTAILGDMSTGRAGMTAADLRAAQAAGQPTVIADIGGEGTRALARSSANTSPAARSALEGVAQDRFAGQSSRVSDFVRNLVPTPANAVKSQEALETAARAANRPAYAAAYKAGNRHIMTPELERLTGSPDVVQAMKSAVQKGKSRAIADGFGSFDPNTRNVQFWDYTYRELRDKASEAYRAGRGDEGNYLKTIANTLRTELDSIVPEYGKARAGAAAYFGAENALEAGQKFVTMRGSIEQARSAVNKMSAPERALFAEGFVSDLADKVSKIPVNRSITIDRIFNSPDGKARISLALGPGRADQLEMFLRRENMMDALRKSLGNSTTARQWQELAIAGGLSGGAEAMLTGNLDAKSILTGAMVSGVVAGHHRINTKLAQRVGEMLASDDPKVLASALKMATGNHTIGNAIRRAETAIEKIAGQGAGGSPPLLPAAAIGRADEQQ